MRDPINELVNELETDGRPTLAWVVRWSEGGEDPVAAAWRRSWTAKDMVRLLEWSGHEALAAVRPILRAPILWASTDTDLARCDAIRRLVPVPPTLGELLAPRRGALAFVPRAARALLCVETAVA